MALASHHTTDGDEGAVAEAEFVGAKNGSIRMSRGRSGGRRHTE